MGRGAVSGPERQRPLEEGLEAGPERQQLGWGVAAAEVEAEKAGPQR